MSRFIVKASKTDDLYLLWSTVWDSAVMVANRKDMLEFLRSDNELRSGRLLTPEGSPDYPDELMRRVDETGTSVRIRYARGEPLDGSWEDDGLAYGSSQFLPRACLADAARAWMALPDNSGEDAWDEAVAPFTSTVTYADE